MTDLEKIRSNLGLARSCRLMPPQLGGREDSLDVGWLLAVMLREVGQCIHQDVGFAWQVAESIMEF